MRKIRVGIIGANPSGGWGSSAHIPALRTLPQYELAAVCTRRRETAQQSADTYGISKAYADPEALANDPDIDLISICVRVPSHLDLVTAALSASKHVYCEWPLASTTTEAQQLCDLAVRKGVTVAVGLQSRFSPVINFAKAVIAEGRIGQVTATTLLHSQPWSTSSAYLQDDNSGGNFRTIPFGHAIDALCYVLGEFTELSASSLTLETNVTLNDGSKVKRTSPDHIAITGRLAGGAMAVAHFKGGPAESSGPRWEISGSKGVLVITAKDNTSLQMADLTISTATGGELRQLEIPEQFRHVSRANLSTRAQNVAGLYAELAKSIGSQRRFRPDFADAVQRHAMLESVKDASAKSCLVKF